VAVLPPAGNALTYATFLGGTGYDRPAAIAVGEAGDLYIAGTTSAVDFPTTPDAANTVHQGFNDAFAVRLRPGSGLPPVPTPTPLPPVPAHTCAPAPLGTITVGNTPRGLAVDSNRQRVYVANFGSGSVSVINSHTNTVPATLGGLPGATGLALDTTRNVLWVTNYTTNQVTPIEINAAATTFTPRQPVAVGAGPWGTAYNPVDGYVYVANSLADTVSVLDAASYAVVGTLSGSFSQPYHLASNPFTGKTYVANFGSASVTVLESGGIAGVVGLYDSVQPYGLAVDDIRNLVYVATVRPHRIVVLGPLRGQPDRFLGWAEFYRGFSDRRRPLPLRAIAVNPDIGPGGDGGHVWSTTATADGSQANQALLIPKGWPAYFHYPLAQPVGDFPTEGIAVDRFTDRVYVSSGASPGMVTVLGDHEGLCAGVGPADSAPAEQEFRLDLFVQSAFARGDVSGDGRVDIVDLAWIATRFGGTDPAADINRDGRVDILDLATAAASYGLAVRE
jgi:YVTN family beta-propeller protein